LNWVIK
jgi:hypothetical protein